MGPQRHHENHHQREERSPKLTLAGRIEGTLNARPWSCTAHGANIDITFNSIATVRKSLPAMRKLQSALRDLPIAAALNALTITVKAGPLPKIRLQPKPGPLTRLLLSIV